MKRHAMMWRAALCSVWLAGAADAAEGPAFVRDPLHVQIDALVRDGLERPAAALALLGTLRLQHADEPDAQRALLEAMGSIEARTGGAVRAGAIAEQLLTLAPADPLGRNVAASNLVRAQVAETAGQIDVAAALAQSALPAFQAGCPGAEAKPGAICDYRSSWRLLQMLQRRALSQGATVASAAHAQTALALAEWAGDTIRQADNLSALAMLAQERSQPDAALQLMARAKRLAAQNNEPRQQASMANAEAMLSGLRGEHRASLQHYRQALALADVARAPRLKSQVLGNMSDAYARVNRPADALRSAEAALVIARSNHDLRLERVLINNAGIAKIGLGHLAEGKKDLAQLLDLWQRGGETGRQAQTLLEFGEALAAAGDARGALDLYQRERALSADLMKVNRAAALKELQTRNEADARRRDIELLSRDNALKTEALANRALQQRIGWLVAAVLLLATALVAVLYRRVRQTHRQLAASHLQLQAQSERDPLTNLANRRHFQSVMHAETARPGHDGSFEGALLLVDIDHFKRVNDVHGHAAGDRVLVEVARRLNQAVRTDDLVVRWGGEEFLILAPRAASGRAEQIAERVLQMIGQTPIDIETDSIRITTSIGYASFPLPPHDAGVPWEQAINLTDMALYTAKNQGRNRAVGIGSAQAETPEALRSIEEDFDRAWHEGRVDLVHTEGPDMRDLLRAA